MVKLTNMSNARPNSEGVLTYQHVQLNGVRIYAGASHVFAEMPPGAMMYVYDAETNPHAPLDLEHLDDVVGEGAPPPPPPPPAEETGTEGAQGQVETEEEEGDGVEQEDTDHQDTEGTEDAEGTGTDEGEQEHLPNPQGSVNPPKRAKSTDGTVAQAIEYIRDIDSVEALDDYISEDTRKTVIKVADERRRALEDE